MTRRLEDKLRNLAAMTTEEVKKPKYSSKFSHIDPEFVIGLLEKGFRMNSISKIYGCSPQTLNRYMKESDPTFSVYNYTRWGREDITVEDAVTLYGELKSTTKAGRIYRVTESLIIRRLEKAGIKRRSLTREDVTSEKTLALYRIHRSTIKVAALLNASPRLVREKLRQNGIDTEQLRQDRKNKERYRLRKETSNILADNGKGLGLVSIAKRYNFAPETIREVLVANGREVKRRGYYLRRDIPPKLVASTFRELGSTKLTADRLNTNENTVRRRLKAAGIQPKKYKKHTQ